MLVTLASRTEPPLPLARWRVRRQVQDIHPGLLAFSEDECRAFFRDTMAMELSEQEIRSVCQRTEGWVARSEEHTSELQSRPHLVCRLLLEKKKKKLRWGRGGWWS